MDSLVEKLGKALDPKCKLIPNKPNTIVNIKNSKNDEALKSVPIDLKINDDSVIVFTFDNKNLRKLKTTDLICFDWIKRKTDGIIYKYINEQHKFIIIEIKTDKPSGCEHQHNSMAAFIAYLIKAIAIEYKINDLSKGISIAHVLITGRPTNKIYMRGDRGVPFNEKINANEVHYEKGKKDMIKLDYLLDCKFNKL